jgi:hypothetical protein
VIDAIGRERNGAQVAVESEHVGRRGTLRDDGKH